MKKIIDSGHEGQSIIITTSGRTVRLVSFEDLPKKAKLQFDYTDEREWDDRRFVKASGCWHDVTQFTMLTDGSPLQSEGWMGAEPENVWAATLVKFDPDDLDLVVMGRMYQVDTNGAVAQQVLNKKRNGGAK